MKKLCAVVAVLSSAVIISLGLAACGSKGPLYLPQQVSAPAAHGSQAARQNRPAPAQPMEPGQVGVSRPNEFSSHSILTQ